MIQERYQQSGFTLVEVIVTIIISSILAVLLVQVMRGHITRSIWPMMQMEERLALQRIMDRVTADYRNLLISDSQPLVTLQSQINSGSAPGGYWHGSPFATGIQILANDCLDLDSSGESNLHRPCAHPVDTLLKVTLKHEKQQLTALFAR